MKVKFTKILIFCLFLLPFSSFAYSRIVSLKPNITEILFALEEGPHVVGVTTYCARPPEVKKLPKVADYIQAFPEAILRLQPDLILGSQENSSQKEVNFLITRGLKVKLFSFSTIPETIQSIEALGDLLGKGDLARQLTGQMRNELARLHSEAEKFPKKKALFVVGYQPLVVAGGDNFFDEACKYLGLINVAHTSRLKYPYYTTEQLIRAAPEIILDFAMGTEGSEAYKKSRKDFWQQFPSIPAVKSKAIYQLDIEKMRAVPTLPEFFWEMFRVVH